MSTQIEKFTAIADKIREKTGTTETMTANDFVDKIDKVFEAGEKAEYDRFWDMYQENGNKTNYSSAFRGAVWGKQGVLKPKYDLRPEIADNMFADWLDYDVDIAEVLKELNRQLDTSQCKSFTQFVMYGGTRHLPVIDTRAANTLSRFSVNSSLWIIDKIILREEDEGTAQNLSTMFASPHNGLYSITFEGVIRSNFNLSGCIKLNKDTITNVINCLSVKTEGLTLTLSKTAVNSAFETSEGAADGETSEEWNNLISTKTNWTRTLL